MGVHVYQALNICKVPSIHINHFIIFCQVYNVYESNTVTENLHLNFQDVSVVDPSSVIDMILSTKTHLTSAHTTDM